MGLAVILNEKQATNIQAIIGELEDIMNKIGIINK